jgi:hydroxymethylpyrimidine pyrophosphatase-like HAD family hydrolase
MTFVRAISVDIDGTLINDTGTIPQKNEEQIHRAKECGVIIIINTLRTCKDSIEIAKKIDAKYIISRNGWSIYNTETNRKISKKLCLRNLFISLVGGKINKGTALQYLCRTLGIPLENVLAIGDSYYDIPMLRMAGIGVALKNSSHIVKRQDKYYVSCFDNNQSGVAEAIRQFIP